MLNNELLEQFCTFLDKKIGLHYPKERWHELEKKILLISRSLGFDHPEKCLYWLLEHPTDKKKLDAIIVNLTIGETYFFRDTQLYAALEQEVLPDIIARCRKHRSIRIWSAACCTGEEPYSIALLLHRLIPDLKEWKVSIMGTDVNPTFLQKAKKAQYKTWSFRTTPPPIIDRYFKKNKELFTLLPEIQKMVRFAPLNLVEDLYPDPSKGLVEFDLILCHNVFIYFSKSQIKKTIHLLTKSLVNEGWLSVAGIEAPFVAEAALNAHTYLGVVFFRKGAAHHREETIVAAEENVSTSRKLTEEINNSEEILQKCMRLYRQKAYQELIDLLQPLLASSQEDPEILKNFSKELILLIRTYANQGNLEAALEWSERSLKIDKLNPSLHYLHALLLQAQGNIPGAIKAIKKALFIDSQFLMAYLILAILEREQGNKKAARHNFKIALELLDKSPPEEILPYDEDLTTEYLKELISNHLRELQNSEAYER
jgi:chemotaxis protein methyltransferase CheR